MTLSVEKTHIIHLDDGLVLTIPSKQALGGVMRKIKQATGPATTSLRLRQLLRKTNPILRGWVAYFRYGASKKTFSYLVYYAWWRVIYWVRRKHAHLTWKQIRRRYYGADRIREDKLVLYNSATMRVERYRYRGTRIATPFNIDVVNPAGARFPPHRPRRCGLRRAGLRTGQLTHPGYVEPGAETTRTPGSVGGDRAGAPLTAALRWRRGCTRWRSPASRRSCRP